MDHQQQQQEQQQQQQQQRQQQAVDASDDSEDPQEEPLVAHDEAVIVPATIAEDDLRPVAGSIAVEMIPRNTNVPTVEVIIQVQLRDASQNTLQRAP